MDEELNQKIRFLNEVWFISCDNRQQEWIPKTLEKFQFLTFCGVRFRLDRTIIILWFLRHEEHNFEQRTEGSTDLSR